MRSYKVRYSVFFRLEKGAIHSARIFLEGAVGPQRGPNSMLAQSNGV